MGRLLVTLVVLALLLAGCVADEQLEPVADPDGGPAGAGVPGHAEAVAAGLVAPAWAPGHYWAYTTNFGVDYALVVSHDHGDAWFVDTTSQDIAWFHARNELSYLGEVRKSDLAGSQGSDRVEYLRFPLEEGKEWTTRWDGVERVIRVVETGTVFRLEAHEGDTLRASYTYDPSKAWFTEFTFHTPDGAAVFTRTLTEHRTGWSGEVYRYQAESLFDVEDASGLGVSQTSGTFDTEEGLTDIWARFRWSCTGPVGAAVWVLAPILPPATEHQRLLIAPDCADPDDIIEILEAPPAATWLVAVAKANVEDDVLVAFEIWGRTLETRTAPW